MTEGYFSSDRNKSVDIYHFKTSLPQVLFTDIQKDNTYCFIFKDSVFEVIDTTILEYVWTFGGTQKRVGAIVNHCFPGPGSMK